MEDMKKATESARKITENIKRVILGKDDVVELSLVALLAAGHLLIEDVPGVGKTMLARGLAGSIGCKFHRIQFTPDLLPTDITGVSVYNQKTGEFSFRPGPIMAQVVLTDEVNRATPKTQSALLEAMEERQVTVDGVTYKMLSPFFVIATQNPIEYEGTFPLPEAQLDRFLMRISLGYPGAKEELEIMGQQERVHPIESLQPVSDPEEVEFLQRATLDVYVDPLIRSYIVSVVDATRDHPEVALGASPRAVLGLFRAARALALVRGRDYVIPDDVKDLAPSVMGHRIIVSPAARMHGVDSSKVITEILGGVAVPGVKATARQG